jgi:hypothetical protein
MVKNIETLNSRNPKEKNKQIPWHDFAIALIKYDNYKESLY